MKMRASYASMMPSPLGPLWVCVTEKGVCAVSFGAPTERLLRSLTRYGVAHSILDHHFILEEAFAQLTAYFSGERRAFSVPLDLLGKSFQRSVWNVLLKIPYGETHTYGGIAAVIGRPTAARAVGRAVGTNRINILVPCHRVLGKDGRLTGYGGGLDRKSALLQLEGVMLDM